MQTADDDMMAALNAQAGNQPGKLIVKFFLKADRIDPVAKVEPDEPGKDKSKWQILGEQALLAGRPIFHEREYVEIRIPGNKDEIRIRPIRNIDRLNWPREYEAFKNGSEAPTTGTPLEQIPFITKVQVEEYGYFRIRTAEQLVGMSDQLAQKFMGHQQLKNRLQAFLDAAAGAAPAEKLRTELEHRDKLIAAQQQQIKELADKVESVIGKQQPSKK